MTSATEETPGLEPDAAADAFDRAFRAVYASFHRRDAARDALPNASRAVITHLAMTGPLTVGELARHLDRSQSTTSGIVAHLESAGLVERRRDDGDARRSLLWLSDDGFARLRRDQSVLSLDLLADAFAALPEAERRETLRAVRRLLDTPFRDIRPQPERTHHDDPDV